MATSGAFSTTNQYVKYTITVTENSQNITNNTSNVTVSVRFYRTNTGYTTYGTGTLYCKIDGVTYSKSVTSADKITNSGIVLFEQTLDISHASDGTKTLTCSAWISHNVITSTEQSYSQTLTTIPRKTTLSVSNGTLGSTMTIIVNSQSKSFKNTVSWKCGSYSGTLYTKQDYTMTSWTPELKLANGAPNGTSVYATITVETFNGDTSLGTNSYGVWCAIPNTVVPSISSITLTDTSGCYSKYGAYVQGKSIINGVISASGAYSSTIKTYKTTFDGKTYSSGTFTTSAISGKGTLSVNTTVTDSRGRTDTDSKSITVLLYSAPKITSLNVYRCDSTGAASSSGAYLAVNFSATITSLNSKNSATYTVKYKKTTESNSAFITEAVTKVAGSYDVSNTIHVFAADTSSSYNIEVNAIDDFTSTTKTGSGSSIFKLASIHSGGKGLAIGKVVEEENSFDVGLTTHLRNTLLMEYTKYIMMKTSDGTSLAVLGISNDNQLVVNWQGYNSKIGKTSVYGNQLNLVGNSVSVTGSTTLNSGATFGGGLTYTGYGRHVTWPITTGKILLTTNSSGVSFSLPFIQTDSTSWTYNYLNIVPGTTSMSFGVSSHTVYFYGKTFSFDGAATFGTSIKLPLNTSGLTFDNKARIYSTANQTLRFRASDETNYEVFLGVNEGSWTLCPRVDGYLKFGSSGYRWGSIYSTSSSITTSDRNCKDNITPLTDNHIEFFMKLKPVSYTFTDGTSGRTHVGFVSQDVEEAMEECGLTDLDFAGFCKDQKTERVEKTIMVEKEVRIEKVDDITGEIYYDTEVVEEEQTVEESVPIEGEYIYSLRYEEFIALNAHVSQHLYNQVNELKSEIENIKAAIGL